MGLLDSLVEKYGGDFNELVAKFEAVELGERFQSWIGTIPSVDEVKRELSGLFSS
jgi:hypothetical protein